MEKNKNLLVDFLDILNTSGELITKTNQGTVSCKSTITYERDTNDDDDSETYISFKFIFKHHNTKEFSEIVCFRLDGESPDSKVEIISRINKVFQQADKIFE